MGIDNIPFGRFTSPALTTVDTQSERLGEEGMRLLFRLIAGETRGRRPRAGRAAPRHARFHAGAGHGRRIHGHAKGRTARETLRLALIMAA